jgi:HD-GYP domain-containing protein (c-di-GMP phosphodiesterase class II)
MESKDDDIVRFSDLIKKGVAPKETDRKKETRESPVEAGLSDDGLLRFSDLDALKLKNRPAAGAGAVSKKAMERPEQGPVMDGAGTLPGDSRLNDLEEYKRLKAGEIKRPLPVSSTHKAEQPRETRDERVRSSDWIKPAPKISQERIGESKEEKVAVGSDEEIPEKAVPGVVEQPVEDVRRIYEEARSYLETIRGKVVTNQRFDVQAARAIIGKMIESRERIDAIYPLTTKILPEEDYNISHQTNVAVYSLKLGFGLGYSREKLLELGLASLMHDTGMFRIPESIRMKREKLTGQEVDVIKTHPDIGRDILSVFNANDPYLSKVAYEHHERDGGQGYPRGLKGSDIHEYARIVAITDSYEAMTHHRPYRKALLHPLSAKELIKQKNSLFAPFVIKAFLQEISLYPPGSYVLLNNKAIAEVVANDKNHPLRPEVRILFDGEGNKVYTDVIVKLAQNPLFFIMDGISQDEIPKGK